MSKTTTTWDQDRVFGCACDSAWAVGAGPGELQATEYFGADCSRRTQPTHLTHYMYLAVGCSYMLVVVCTGRCPTGNDPETSTVDETDCSGKAAPGGYVTGAAGNICYAECSNRGICNYRTGQCKCFAGFSGFSCSEIDALSK